LIIGKSTNELLLSFGVADLVFFQNGMLEPWLESKGLKDGNQVLAYFAVSKLFMETIHIHWNIIIY